MTETKTYSTTTARTKFNDLVKRAADGKERVALTRRGKEVAAIVPVEDLDLLKRMEDEEKERELKAAKKALKEFRSGKTTPLEKYKKETGS